MFRSSYSSWQVIDSVTAACDVDWRRGQPPTRFSGTRTVTFSPSNLPRSREIVGLQRLQTTDPTTDHVDDGDSTGTFGLGTPICRTARAGYGQAGGPNCTNLHAVVAWSQSGRPPQVADRRSTQVHITAHASLAKKSTIVRLTVTKRCNVRQLNEGATRLLSATADTAAGHPMGAGPNMPSSCVSVTLRLFIAKLRPRVIFHFEDPVAVSD